jgi:hypothetical protein
MWGFLLSDYFKRDVLYALHALSTVVRRFRCTAVLYLACGFDCSETSVE